MHILFLDESGTAPAPDKCATNPIFVLGGVAVPEASWNALKSDLDRIRQHFGVTGELKWRFFAPQRQGSKAHSLSHLSAELKDQLRERLLASVVDAVGVRVIAVVVDTAMAYRLNHIATADDLYHAAFKRITERFQYHLQSMPDERGIVVCDNRNNDQDQRLKEFHQLLLAGGRYVATYDRLIEGLFIAASHQSVGTQFADLVVGAVYRAEAHGDVRFLNQIREAFRRSPRGEIEGYGLVRLPKASAPLTGIKHRLA